MKEAILITISILALLVIIIVLIVQNHNLRTKLNQPKEPTEDEVFKYLRSLQRRHLYGTLNLKTDQEKLKEFDRAFIYENCMNQIQIDNSEIEISFILDDGRKLSANKDHGFKAKIKWKQH